MAVIYEYLVAALETETHCAPGDELPRLWGVEHAWPREGSKPREAHPVEGIRLASAGEVGGEMLFSVVS